MSKQLQEASKTAPKAAPRPRPLPPSPVPVEKVLNAKSYRELLSLAEALNVEGSEADSTEQLRELLLTHIKLSYRLDVQTRAPPIAETLSLLTQYSETKRQFLELVNETEDFVYGDVLEWFVKLRITSDKVWVKREDFQNIRDECEKKPMLLVAGNSIICQSVSVGIAFI
ncbi:uncharacterized protein LOC134185244 [Corticium candelabrum]|uniref:uncharacterized protein LOC134185244 n=1 Tax=Corticium candelabrum TaxID=121492 RepID=UPI002E271EA8|nr:uncharacterized protein LOC134185244 [Corticium candelabrum]